VKSIKGYSKKAKMEWSADREEESKAMAIKRYISSQELKDKPVCHDLITQGKRPKMLLIPCNTDLQ